MNICHYRNLTNARSHGKGCCKIGDFDKPCFVLLAILQGSSYTRAELVAWLSGNALVSINVVTLRRARLVLGWVTMHKRVNHLCM